METRPAEDDRTAAMVDGAAQHREFVFADCLVVGGRVYEYGWDAERLLVGSDFSVDSGEYGLAAFDELDRLREGPIIYSCGSTLARGSSGYFMKTVGDRLAWLLVCTDSEAFTVVRRRRDGVEFVSQLGERWVLPAEDITAVFVEPPGQRADRPSPSAWVVPAPRRTGSAVVW